MRFATLIFVVGLGACTTLLGDNFEVVEGAGGSGGSSSSAGAGPGGGGSGGAGGAAVSPLSCQWDSVRMIASLESEPAPDNQYSDRIEMVRGAQNVRIWVGRRYADGIHRMELWSVDETVENLHTIIADSVQHAFRLDGTTSAALLHRNLAAAPGLALVMAEIDDGDDTGTSATTTDLTTVTGSIDSFGARAIATGTGAAAIVFTHRVTGGDYHASFLRSDAPTAVVEFDNSTNESSLTGGDYDIAALLRDPDGDNHAVFGSAFEMATRHRHFIIPDNVSGLVTPTRDEMLTSSSPLLLGMRRRADDDFLVAYTLSSVIELRLGVIPAAELDTHQGSMLTSAGQLAASELPDEASMVLTDEQLVLLGARQDDASGLRLVVSHRAGVMRHNAVLAFPDQAIFPAEYNIERMALIPEGTSFDTALGGALLVSWYVRANDGHDRLYYGAIDCTPI